MTRRTRNALLGGKDEAGINAALLFVAEDIGRDRIRPCQPSYFMFIPVYVVP
jgi:hypothetical protein